MFASKQAMSLDELAEHFGISRRRVGQLLDRAHAKLRRELGEDGAEMLEFMELTKRKAMPRKRRIA